MSIRVVCPCGEVIHTDDAFAGGHVKCTVCDHLVAVPDTQAAQDKLRFQCPHCSTRVVAKKSSAGKTSHCPACGKTYLVPDPKAAPEPNPASLVQRQRFEIGVDDIGFLPAYHPLIEPDDSQSIDEVDRSEGGRKIVRSHGGDDPDPWPMANYVHPPADDIRAIPARETNTTPKLATEFASQPAPGTVAQDSSTARATVAPSPESPANGAASPQRSANGTPKSHIETVGAIAHVPAKCDNAAPIHVSLKYLGGEQDGQAVPVTAKNFIVGSERDCHFRVQCPSISQHHCVLKLDNHVVRIRDLGSRNGIFVNGHRIYGEVILHHSDLVRIGEMRFKVIIVEEELSAEAAAKSQPSLEDFTIIY